MSEDGRRTAFAAGSVPEDYDRYLTPVVFAPWAQRFVDFVGIEAGQHVLDVASGTGVAARAAARLAGPTGRVVASDASPAMLRRAAAAGPRPGAAAVETLECSATALETPDGSYDRVLCHQGLPFIPDRVAALREMRRVLRPDGAAGVAVWVSGHRCEPFETYIDVLRSADVPPPFPGAYEMASYVMGESDLAAAFEAAGYGRLEITTADLNVSWPSADEAVDAIAGTPFGPVVAALEPDRQQQLRRAMVELFFADGEVRRTTRAVLARGTT